MITLSIDFGTSNTVAALQREGRAPHTLEFEGSSLLSSAVFLADDGTLLVGREALRSARIDPSRFEANPKRRIDDGEVLLGPTPVTVIDMIAAVLRAVREEALRQTGGEAPGAVVLTHPAQWGAARRNLLLAAARAAGLSNLTMIPEPVAAAAQFTRNPGRELPPGGTVAIYDLGGGTFDVAVIGRSERAGEDELSVLAEGGLADLGGLDFDQALLDHVGIPARRVDAAAWSRILRPQDASARRAARALAEDIRAAKESLSRYAQTDVAMPDPIPDVHVTRDEFESLIRAALMRSIAVLDNTIGQAGVAPDRLTGIFLVGGSSRIPLVAASIREALGVTPTALDQPETAVALGALTLPRSTDTVRTAHVGTPQDYAQTRSVATALPPSNSAPSTAAHSFRKRRHSPVPVIAGALVLIAAIAAGTVLLLNRPSETATVQQRAPTPIAAVSVSSQRPPRVPTTAPSPDTTRSTPKTVRSSARSSTSAAELRSTTPTTTTTTASVSTPTPTTQPTPTVRSTSRAAEPGSTAQPVAYRQGYQVAREDPQSFVPATGDDAERVIATLCADDQRSSITGARSQDWIDGCFAGTIDAVDDRSAVTEEGPTGRAWYRVGYQTGREHHSEIAARQNGDLLSSCVYEAHLGEVPGADRERFALGCVDGTTQAAALAVPTADRRTAPEPVEPVETPVAATPPPVDPSDLGLSVPITTVSCDGEFVVFVGAAVTPGAYESDVERFLTNSPGARYLRTDRACSSLVQDRDGNPIYAVFHGPFPSRVAACSVSVQFDGSTVKQLIDSGEPMADEQC